MRRASHVATSDETPRNATLLSPLAPTTPLFDRATITLSDADASSVLRPASTAAAREVPASGVVLDRRNGPQRALGRGRAAARRRTKIVGVAAEPLEDHRAVVHDDRCRLNARRGRAAGAAPHRPLRSQGRRRPVRRRRRRRDLAVVDGDDR